MFEGIKLTAIVAMTADRVIGHRGQLPWQLPEDLAFFKRTTQGHAIVMGRKTYESIGRPLPKRRNIVLTRDRSWEMAGVEVIHELSDLALLTPKIAEAFVIGGAEIYSLCLPYLDELLVSHVNGNYAGDTFFPSFEKDFPIELEIERYDSFHVTSYKRV